MWDQDWVGVGQRAQVCLCCGFFLEPGSAWAPSFRVGTAVGAQPGSEGRAGTQATEWPPELGGEDTEHGPWAWLPLGPLREAERWVPGVRGVETHPLWGEVTQRNTDRTARAKKEQVPEPFSCPEVQNRQESKATHLVSPHKDPHWPHTGTSHRPTLTPHTDPHTEGPSAPPRPQSPHQQWPHIHSQEPEQPARDSPSKWILSHEANWRCRRRSVPVSPRENSSVFVFFLDIFKLLLEKRVRVSPWKCAKSFPTQVFIGLSPDSQLREWQILKKSKTLPASNEGESMSNFSYYSVKWHQGVVCFVVLGTTSCTQSDFFPLDAWCREVYSKWDPGWNEQAKRHLTPVF